MTEIEKLKSLLREARGYIDTPGYRNAAIEEDLADRIDAALAERISRTLEWTDHPGGVDATAFDQQTGSGVTIAPEIKGFRWYIKSPETPVISSAWFDTMDEAKASAQMMVDAFRRGVHRGE